METFTEFLGWCTIFNILMILVSGIMLLVAREKIIAKHSKMFGVDEKDLPRLYFQFLANYKILILFFNVIPFFALKIMGY